MGFFRRMLGKADSNLDVIARPASAPSTANGVGYDGALVDTLLTHHAQLGKLFSGIKINAKAGNYDETRSLLLRFKTSLQSHILTENVRFYSYVEKTLANDSESTRTMHDFRHEMNGIARTVTGFVDKWQGREFATVTERTQFFADYAAVEKLLAQRFDNEENNLYPIYRAA